MSQSTQSRSNAQAIFREIVFGTLVYAVVLGFFNDYTNILRTTSYSTTFLVAVVLQLLTYATLQLKKMVSSHVRQRRGRVALVLSVWFVLFVSKFVFLAVIDRLFGDAVEIDGFVGLMAMIVTMTVVKESLDYLYGRLAD